MQKNSDVLTFFAMMLLRFLFHTFVTVPPLPAPRSSSTSRSSSLTRSSSFFFRLPFVLECLRCECDGVEWEVLEDLDELSGTVGGCFMLVVGVVCPLCTRLGGRGGGAPADNGGAGESGGGGESGPEVCDELLDFECSCSLAISSWRRSARGIQFESPLPFSTADPPNSDDAERVGFGIDLEMSRPRGFLRDIDDLTEPNVDEDDLEPVDASSAGDDCDDRNGGRVGAGDMRSSRKLPGMAAGDCRGRKGLRGVEGD